MSFYAMFFWWLMGVISCFVLYSMFIIFFWTKLVARGDIAIKDKDGVWIGTNLPNNACNRPASADGMQSESNESAGS